MQTVRVSTLDLTNELLKNKDAHVKAFNAALRGWRKETARQLRENAKRIESGEILYPANGVGTAPESHEDDYDRAVKMCQMSVDDQVELTQQEFTQYVLDQWNWSAGFTTQTAMYAKVMKKR